MPLMMQFSKVTFSQYHARYSPLITLLRTTTFFACQKASLVSNTQFSKLIPIVPSAVSGCSVIADIGCGEGYYSSAIAESTQASFCGIDISKDALRYASKELKNSEFAVASAFDLPFTEGSVDCVLNIFAPSAYEEFHRILKNDGALIKAVPLSEHLWGLKCALYDKPYSNKPELRNEELFELVSFEEIKYEKVGNAWNYKETTTTELGGAGDIPLEAGLGNFSFEQKADSETEHVKGGLALGDNSTALGLGDIYDVEGTLNNLKMIISFSESANPNWQNMVAKIGNEYRRITNVLNNTILVESAFEEADLKRIARSKLPSFA